MHNADHLCSTPTPARVAATSRARLETQPPCSQYLLVHQCDQQNCIRCDNLASIQMPVAPNIVGLAQLVSRSQIGFAHPSSCWVRWGETWHRLKAHVSVLQCVSLTDSGSETEPPASIVLAAPNSAHVSTEHNSSPPIALDKQRCSKRPVALITDALATMPLPDIIQHSMLLLSKTCPATPCLRCDDGELDLETGKPGRQSSGMRLEAFLVQYNQPTDPCSRYLHTAILALIPPNMVSQCRIIIIRIA